MPLKWILDRLRGRKRTHDAPQIPLTQKTAEEIKAGAKPMAATRIAAAHVATRGFGHWIGGGGS